MKLTREPSPAGPGHYRAEARHGAISITVRWFRRDTAVAFGAFFVAWNGLTAGALVASLRCGELGSAVLVLTPFVLFGLGITYVLGAVLLNRTTIRLVDGELGARHGPLPWSRSCGVPARFVRRVVAHPDQHDVRTCVDERSNWAVVVETTDGRSLRLLGGNVHPHARAEYVAWVIEEELGLADTTRPTGPGSPRPRATSDGAC